MKLGNKRIEDIVNARNKNNCVFLKWQENKPILFSHGKKSGAFFTEDSKLYITPREQGMLRKGIILDRRIKKWDSASSKIVRDYVHYKACYKPNYSDHADKLLKTLEQRYEMFNDSFAEASKNFLGQFSLIRLWNLSIIGSVLFGMIMMTFVYRYLGQGAAADQLNKTNSGQQSGKVLGAESFRNNGEQDFASQVLEIENADQKNFEKEIQKMVEGYPIEKMVPYIAKKDRTVAAFLVAIAKKESSWGERRPVLNGQDCYNYWGYRGRRKLMGSGGHTCFNSPKDAVDTVSKRIETLVEKYGNNTPAEMVEPWKCGYDCNATGGRAAANKWVSDVAKYFNKLNNSEEE